MINLLAGGGSVFRLAYLSWSVEGHLPSPLGAEDGERRVVHVELHVGQRAARSQGVNRLVLDQNQIVAGRRFPFALSISASILALVRAQLKNLALHKPLLQIPYLA